MQDIVNGSSVTRFHVVVSVCGHESPASGFLTNTSWWKRFGGRRHLLDVLRFKTRRSLAKDGSLLLLPKQRPPSQNISRASSASVSSEELKRTHSARKAKSRPQNRRVISRTLRDA